MAAAWSRTLKTREALWPDTDGVTAARSLNVTLYRLRRLLNSPDAVRCDSGRLSLDTRRCWVDIWAFEKTVAEMDAIGEYDRRAGHFDAALDLYQGAFLPAEDAPWVVLTRQRLRSKFVRAVCGFAERCDETGHPELTISVYQRALEIDQLAEELYRRLMVAHGAMGQVAEAVSVFHRCRVVMAKLLNVQPSAETQRLYLTLLRQSPVELTHESAHEEEEYLDSHLRPQPATLRIEQKSVA